MNFDHQKIEAKWQKQWQESQIYEVDLTLRQAQGKPKFYNLMMFPYPSAEGLHVGNMYAFTGADVYGRFKAMQGYEVFEPIGLDGFGIHSENYAISINKHPAEQAKISEKHFYEQLSRIGNRFSWNNRLETYDPEYYRWTQWLFVQMFKHGLAYRKKAQVNWCPSCKTVLADEQVEAGLCERCKTPAEKRENEQWFFKITDYAQRLLDNIEKINWPEKIKISQRNWIGRSEGVEISWKMEGSEPSSIITFTTRLDTIYGATFLVLAPEHELVNKLKLNQAAKEYVAKALLKTEQQRKLEEKKKTGVDTGYQVVHPLTGKLIPVWIADFVLKDYGTGAVMGVPAHDERDYDFAKKYKLAVIDILKDKEEIIYELEKKGLAKRTVNFHLRDWCVSRQRYWGPPIPMIYCEKCAKKITPGSELPPRGGNGMAGWYPEEDLPVKLPYVKDSRPRGDGKTPLERAPREWLEVACPECGGAARRAAEIIDNFVDSAWYYLRYPSVDKNIPGSKNIPSRDGMNLPFDPEITKKWLPVDAYIGGAEHAVLHLMYSRFIWMALQDWGYIPKSTPESKNIPLRSVSWEEPFPFLYGHGLIIKDGAKMSKSRGNIVNPDEYIEKYGTDALRMYLMFIGPYDQGGDFQDSGMVGMRRFLNRVEKICDKVRPCQETRTDLEALRHKTIKKVSQAMKDFRFNVGIARLMEYVNGLEKYGTDKESLRVLVLLLAPFAPYISEELWFKLGGKFSIHQQTWPKFEERLATNALVTFVVQVNGKLRAKLELDPKAAQDKAKVFALAKANDHIKTYIKDKKIVKEIFVAGKLVNLVVK